MHSMFPIADFQAEAQRRQDEIAFAEHERLARQCPDDNKSRQGLPLRLLNFLLLLLPFVARR